VTGLAPATAYRWRARIQYADATGAVPAEPAHGPWRRKAAYAGAVDIRTTGQCDDGVDNDNDGAVDFGADAGCLSEADNSERGAPVACDDGVDNDGDGRTDFSLDAGLTDLGCRDRTSTLEDPQCQDGIDNDGQIGIDFDGGASVNGGVPLAEPDPQCVASWGNRERRPPTTGCGLGPELAVLLLILGKLGRSRQRPHVRIDH
jgi:hypothetical protein